MKHGTTERWLLKQIQNIPVIDAHEHLPLESKIIEEHHDALTLFRQYTRLVMFSAGMGKEEFEKMHDPEAPIGERFDIFDKYRDLIRFSGPARAAYISLEKFYGETELTRDNFQDISLKMQKMYKQGLYKGILREACGIETVLQNSPLDEIDFDSELMRPVPTLWGYWDAFTEFTEKTLTGELRYKSPDEYLESQTQELRTLVERGAVGFKSRAYLYCRPDRRMAIDTFKRLRSGDETAARIDIPNPLCNYLASELYAIASKLDKTVAVHTGVWGDFRELDCKEMIPHLAKHPGTRFDLFHMGIPSVRDFGRIGANFPNVWLNMCWGPTVSPAMAANVLDEWLDQVGANKIIAFGGDVRWPVEKVYGHLTIAKDVVSTVLGRRIDRGLMTRGQAISLATRWFYTNPQVLYDLM